MYIEVPQKARVWRCQSVWQWDKLYILQGDLQELGKRLDLRVQSMIQVSWVLYLTCKEKREDYAHE